MYVCMYGSMYVSAIFGRALAQAAKPHAPSCVVTRAKRYNPDFADTTTKSGSKEEDAENLREFVNTAADSQQSRTHPAVSVPVCGVAMTADSEMSVEKVAQVTPLSALPSWFVGDSRQRLPTPPAESTPPAALASAVGGSRRF